MCWKKLRGRGHLDHCHDTGYARHLTCRVDNLIEGMLKKNGVRTYEQLMIWAHRMATLRMMPGLVLGEDWARLPDSRSNHMERQTIGISA